MAQVKALHPKIQEIKLKARTINNRSLSVDASGQLSRTDFESSLDQRIVRGYLCIWGQRNWYGEKFIKGAFAKSIREHGPGTKAHYEIKFLNQHRQADPLSLFAVLKEDDIGLYFETVALDDVDTADRVLKQLKSRTLNNFSLGFDYLWDRVEWDDTDDSLVILEAILFEGSVVTIPADFGTYAIRSMEDLEELDEEILEFLSQVPSKLKLQARSLFARQKSLIDLDTPLEPRGKAPIENEPVEAGIDYAYLSKHLTSF
jgi:HK97 family phage prohead protease